MKILSSTPPEERKGEIIHQIECSCLNVAQSYFETEEWENAVKWLEKGIPIVEGPHNEGIFLIALSTTYFEGNSPTFASIQYASEESNSTQRVNTGKLSRRPEKQKKWKKGM